jgi:hypothetical protein
VACARPAARQPTPVTAVTAASARPVTATPPTSASPAGATPVSTSTAPATPIPGANLQVGSWTVVAGRFRAQISQTDGVNIRSSPEVTPDNRTGSVPAGAIVDVEGSVAQGQEAVPGQGTNWYYLGSVGTAPPIPQFIYGPPGTLTPVSASATPAASAAASPAPAAASSPTPTPTP